MKWSSEIMRIPGGSGQLRVIHIVVLNHDSYKACWTLKILSRPSKSQWDLHTQLQHHVLFHVVLSAVQKDQTSGFHFLVLVYKTWCFWVRWNGWYGTLYWAANQLWITVNMTSISKGQDMINVTGFPERIKLKRIPRAEQKSSYRNGRMCVLIIFSVKWWSLM